MKTSKRMQRFLSIFLACIMILNVPMSALAAEDVLILSEADNEEIIAEQEEFLSGETAVGEEETSTEFWPEEELLIEEVTEAAGNLEECTEEECSTEPEDWLIEEETEEIEAAEEQKSAEAEETAVITLDQTTLTVAAGASETLKATVTLPSTEEGSESTEAPTVTWGSSDNTVATVENGTVQGVKIGTATVTASVADANGTTYTATCAVEVVNGTEVVAEGTWSKTSSDDVHWKLTKDGTMTISGTGAMKNSSNMDDSRPYKTYVSLIKKLVVEDGITSIGKYNFVNCNNLKSITLAASVKTIDGYAFRSCKGLETVEIPDTVTKVGSYVFAQCTALKSVSYNSATIPMFAFDSCINLETFIFGPKVTKLDGAFSNCGFKEIVLPETIKAVDSKEFRFFQFNGCLLCWSLIPHPLFIIF